VWRERYTFEADKPLGIDIFTAAGAAIRIAAGLVRPTVDNRAHPGLDRTTMALSFLKSDPLESVAAQEIRS
jgi:hypothetical protein